MGGRQDVTAVYSTRRSLSTSTVLYRGYGVPRSLEVPVQYPPRACVLGNRSYTIPGMSELNGHTPIPDETPDPRVEERRRRRARVRAARNAYLQYKQYVHSCTGAGLSPESLLIEKDREAWDLLRASIQNGHLLTPSDVQAAVDAGASLDQKYDLLGLMLEEVMRARLVAAQTDPQQIRPIEYRGVAAALLAVLQLRRSCQQAPGSVSRPVQELLSQLPSLIGPIDADSLDAPQAPSDSNPPRS